MPQFYELYTSKALAAYWETANSNRIPYLGEGLFPSSKKIGLTIEWAVGYDGLPVALMPAAFDTKPNIRDRINAKSVMTEMPFFRESMRIGEKERQQLLIFQELNNNAYATEIMRKVYDDASNLVSGALVQPERMRMSMMTTGKISIAAPNDSGNVVQYDYNFDPNGTWNSSNVVSLTTKKWSDPATSDPIADIEDMKRRASAKGVTITKAIVSEKTWGYLMKNQAIKNDMNVLNGQKIIMTNELLNSYLINKTGVTFAVYNKQFKDESGTSKQFFPDDIVTFIPDGTLGKTYFGTTPEEADLMASGDPSFTVSIVETGIALTTLVEHTIPVNVQTVCSEIVIPSFEGMNSVFNLVVSSE